MPINAKNLIWVDMEMTGLQPDSDQILEIATVVTDAQLEILAEGPVIAIHQPPNILAAMDKWNTKQHTHSGLVSRVMESQFTTADAEKNTLDFLRRWTAKGVSPMCGNSICQDRRFMARLMPTLEAYFHYRHLDVSTIKELAQRWAPEVYKGFKKQSTHLALNDIKDSIDELKYYRKHFLRY